MSIKKTYVPLSKIRVRTDYKTLIPKKLPTSKWIELFSLMYIYYVKYWTPLSLRKAAVFLWIQHWPVYDRMRQLIRLWYVYKTWFSRGYIPSAWAILLVKEQLFPLMEYEV